LAGSIRIARINGGSASLHHGKKVVGRTKDVVFKGIVENVDANGNRVTVSHDYIPGGSNAIFNYGLTASKVTMTHQVDNPEVLTTLKPGDRVTAKVSEGDLKVLYDLKLVPPEDTPVFFPKK
jgi:Cu/Ag efflux protein CusF